MHLKLLIFLLLCFSPFASMASVKFDYDLEDEEICRQVLPDFIFVAERSHRSVHLVCSGTVLSGYFYIQGNEPLEHPSLGGDFHIPQKKPYLSARNADLLFDGINKYSKLLRLDVDVEISREFEGWVVEIH